MIRSTEQSDLQDLERLCLRYPERAMELLSLRGKKKFIALYEKVSGINIVTEVWELRHKMTIM